jgi:hypothetical protein
VNLVEKIGTAGISSDEEILPRAPGQQRRYAVFEKPWRAEALCNLYRYLDLIHAENRNPNGNPIRSRQRTMQSRQRRKAPKGLPKDCYDQLFLEQQTVLQRQLLQIAPSVRVGALWSGIQQFAR